MHEPSVHLHKLNMHVHKSFVHLHKSTVHLCKSPVHELKGFIRNERAVIFPVSNLVYKSVPTIDVKQLNLYKLT